MLVAEVIIPTSSSTGERIYLKVVDDGDRASHDGAIDIMGAICSLKKYKHLFPCFYGFPRSNYKGGHAEWDKLQPEFVWTDSEYNPITGEIEGYTPEAVKKIVDKINGSASTSGTNRILVKFKSYTTLSARKKWPEYFYVKLFVPSIYREAAEKKLRHKLPDGLIRDANIVLKDNAETQTTKLAYESNGDLSDAEIEIMGKRITVKNNDYSHTDWPGISSQEITRNAWSHQLNGSSELIKTYRAEVPLPKGYPMTYNGKYRPTMENYLGTTKNVTHIVVNQAVAKRFENAFKDAYTYYGPDIGRVAPGVCILTNTLRNDSKSKMHEIGFAMDLDYYDNRPYWWREKIGKTPYWQTPENTEFRQKIYRPFLIIFERHGIRNLGWDSERYVSNPKKRYGDWMHFQAAIQVNAWGAGVRDPNYKSRKELNNRKK